MTWYLYLKQMWDLNDNFPIYLDNDGNMGVFGVNRYGKGRGIKNLIYLTLSTDIGAGVILKSALKHIGKAIGSYLINVYNPSMILLDGGIVRPNKGDVVYFNEFFPWGNDANKPGTVAIVIDNDTRINASRSMWKGCQEWVSMVGTGM